MSHYYKNIAIQRIDESFKYPTWYNINSLKFLAMLDLTDIEMREVQSYFKHKIHSHNTDPVLKQMLSVYIDTLLKRSKV